MAGTVIVLCGLPGSGKTTWAEQYLKDHPIFVCVSKDAIRSMLYYRDGHYRAELEGLVCAIRDCNIEHALLAGHGVISDDTNLDIRHIQQIQHIARTYGATVEIMPDFTYVPLGVCLDQNRARTDKAPIPEKDILKMCEQHFVDGTWKYAYMLEEEV